MSDNSPAKGLSYYLPEPAKPHTALQIPGSHTIYVGPPACGRRHAMHAMQYGDSTKVSFLQLSENDVALGKYERFISDAVFELSEILPDSPRIFFITFFCVDSFLGTDEKALLSSLHARFPDRQFAVNRVEPVLLSKTKAMGGKKHVNLYSFLKKTENHDAGVNFVGNFTSLDPDCEFLKLLKDLDAGPVREIFRCETYEQYQDMAKSSLTVTLNIIADGAAKYMEEALGIPRFYFPVSYSAAFIRDGYVKISKMLGKEHSDFTGDYDSAVKYARETAKLLNGLPVAVDSSAFFMPFAAARALMEYGFNVSYILRSRHKFDADASERDYIKERCPQVTIIIEDEYIDVKNTEPQKKCLAIGADCARVLNAEFFADVWHDEGYFGFHGIRKLMTLIRAVFQPGGEA